MSDMGEAFDEALAAAERLGPGQRSTLAGQILGTGRLTRPELVDRLCLVMHNAYEAAAAREGWETQERSRRPWAEVPAANKATMRVAVEAMLHEIGLSDPSPETGV
jgi:hypothetical protein